ncbi:hypothetical protein [Pseudomonas ogarae]
MQVINYPELLALVIEKVRSYGQQLIAEWQLPMGQRGQGDNAKVDTEIETVVRKDLIELLNCDFLGGGRKPVSRRFSETV